MNYLIAKFIRTNKISDTKDDIEIFRYLNRIVGEHLIISQHKALCDLARIYKRIVILPRNNLIDFIPYFSRKDNIQNKINSLNMIKKGNGFPVENDRSGKNKRNSIQCSKSLRI
ncbi:hypothetical protein TCON_0843 [Astathelohania contejeani]|uniref:Homing endonuclease LAGLIDADG domain-containing protein n=1 Tax=Astathelohania contejeani TaxID=164912 RepID=A0ABQ7I0Q6_9MICR|nr:hypothetical protein TCON_0843 [Thelohania contejeani]